MPHTDRLAPSAESLGIDPAKLEKLYARAQRDVDEGVLPSCQLAVARDGQLAALRTFGAASDDSLYVVFSCSKAITSATAWQLLEEGKLSLDERVADTLPEFATNGKDAVRVEQLFTHTAGFPHAPSGLRDWTPREALRARVWLQGDRTVAGAASLRWEARGLHARGQPGGDGSWDLYIDEPGRYEVLLRVGIRRGDGAIVTYPVSWGTIEVEETAATQEFRLTPGDAAKEQLTELRKLLAK